MWATVRSEAQYPLSLAAHFMAQMLILCLDLMVIWVLFLRVHALGEWNRGQVIMLYGVSGTAFGIGDLLVSAVERTTDHVRLGTFDRFLLRPAGTLLQLLASEFELRRSGRLIQPLVVLVVAIATVPIRWTPAHVVLLVWMIIGGALIFSGVWVATAAAAFWLPSTQEFANAFTYGGSYATQYPISIMGEWMRRLLLTAVPLAFVAYVPCLELLDAPNPLDIPRWLSYAAPLVAIPVLLFARFVWRAGNRRYRSTGS